MILIDLFEKIGGTCYGNLRDTFADNSIVFTKRARSASIMSFFMSSLQCCSATSGNGAPRQEIARRMDYQLNLL